MYSDITISLSLVFSIIAAIGVIVNIVSNVKKNHETEEQKQLDIEKNFVKINMKLDSFCEQTREILKNQEKANDEIKSFSEKLIKEHERVETLFKYKEDHELRIKKLEERK